MFISTSNVKQCMYNLKQIRKKKGKMHMEINVKDIKN